MSSAGEDLGDSSPSPTWSSPAPRRVSASSGARHNKAAAESCRGTPSRRAAFVAAALPPGRRLFRTLRPRQVDTATGDLLTGRVAVRFDCRDHIGTTRGSQVLANAHK